MRAFLRAAVLIFLLAGAIATLTHPQSQALTLAGPLCIHQPGGESP